MSTDNTENVKTEDKLNGVAMSTDDGENMIKAEENKVEKNTGGENNMIKTDVGNTDIYIRNYSSNCQCRNNDVAVNYCSTCGTRNSCDLICKTCTRTKDQPTKKNRLFVWNNVLDNNYFYLGAIFGVTVTATLLMLSDNTCHRYRKF